MTLETLKREVCGAIDALRGELIAASHAIHANPELAFEEKFAASLLDQRRSKATASPSNAAPMASPPPTRRVRSRKARR